MFHSVRGCARLSAAERVEARRVDAVGDARREGVDEDGLIRRAERAGVDGDHAGGEGVVRGVFPEACAQLARQVGGVVQEEGEDEERARRVRRRRQQREREQAQRAADAEEEVDDDP